MVHRHKHKYDVNYNKTLPGVVKSASFRSLFSIGVSCNLQIKQMDIINTFLYGLLDKIVYIEQSHGFVQGILICWLKQALYSLKQTLRVWYLVICNFLKEKDFIAINFDQNELYSTNKHLFLAIYVNDLLLFGANEVQIDVLKREFCSCFWITDLENVFHYLGIEICCNCKKSILILLQTAYLKAILKQFGMSDYNPINTPINSSLSKMIMSSSLDYQAFPDTILW